MRPTRFLCRLIRVHHQLLLPSTVSIATFALSVSFIPLCRGKSLPVPAEGKGEWGQVRRQQKHCGMYSLYAAQCMKFI